MTFDNWLNGIYDSFCARSEWLYNEVDDRDYDGVVKFCEGAYNQAQSDTVDKILLSVGYYKTVLEEMSVEKKVLALTTLAKIGHKVSTHQMPEASGQYFICGEAGEEVAMGLPQYIEVCPSYGSDSWALYEFKEMTSVEW